MYIKPAVDWTQPHVLTWRYVRVTTCWRGDTWHVTTTTWSWSGAVTRPGPCLVTTPSDVVTGPGQPPCPSAWPPTRSSPPWPRPASSGACLAVCGGWGGWDSWWSDPGPSYIWTVYRTGGGATPPGTGRIHTRNILQVRLVFKVKKRKSEASIVHSTVQYTNTDKMISPKLFEVRWRCSNSTNFGF